MNISTKAILASTLLTALLTGQTAIAGNNDYVISKAVYVSMIDSVVIRDALFHTVVIDTESTFETDNR